MLTPITFYDTRYSQVPHNRPPHLYFFKFYNFRSHGYLILLNVPIPRLLKLPCLFGTQE